MVAHWLPVRPVRAGIPLTTNDLDYVKMQLTVEPWKSGWEALQADPRAYSGDVAYAVNGARRSSSAQAVS